MSIAKIIRHFEGIGKVPISLEDVLKQIKTVVLDEKVEIKGVDEPADVLRGFHYRYYVPPHPDSALMPERVAVAAYSLQQPLAWQRLVCCKELIHIFDREPICTSSREQVVRLGQKIAGGDKFEEVNGENIQSFFDELAKYQALAILFPFGLREEIIGLYQRHELSVERISEWVQLPPEMTRIVLSEGWLLLRESLLAAG